MKPTCVARYFLKPRVFCPRIKVQTPFQHLASSEPYWRLIVNCFSCAQPLPTLGKFCSSCGAPCDVRELRFGDYEVVDVLGEGGMGQVFKAIQPRLKREVCIKTLQPKLAANPEVLTRFEREALTTAQLKHPNIVAIHDVGRTPNGMSYIVMELADGRPLRSVLGAECPLEVPRALSLVDQILAALAEAHANGIIHRDLKPSNVVVMALKDGSEHCKVLDFGIARVIDDSADTRLTRAGHIVGTPAYMAPEQISPDHDHRVDIYAAGAILFEALTGHRVFAAKNEVDMFQMVLTQDAPPPSSRMPGLSPAIDSLVLKALARDPEIRFKTATEFREALVPLLGNRKPTIVPPALPKEALPPSSDSLQGTNSTNNPLTLMASFLAISREHSARMRALSVAVADVFAVADSQQLLDLLRALKAAASDKQNEAAVAEVLSELKRQVVSHASLLLTWFADDETRVLATALLKMVGIQLMGPAKTALTAALPANRARQALALWILEPRPTELYRAVHDSLEVTLAVIDTVNQQSAVDGAAFLADGLIDFDSRVRQAALKHVTEAHVPYLVMNIRRLLQDDAASIREEARRLLNDFEDAGAVPYLEKWMRRPDITLIERRRVASTLAHVAGPTSLKVIERLSQSEKDPECLELLNSARFRLQLQTGSMPRVDKQSLES